MRIPGVKTGKSFSRWVRARLFGGGLILGYHRIANMTRDEYEICVAPEHFEEQMDALRKYAHPVSLTKLVEYLKDGSLPPRSVAVTFDDGYVDNLHEAKPILERYEIPATVFVCTGYAGKEFWWDELDRLMLSSQSPLSSLHVEAGDKPLLWNQPSGRSETDLSCRRQFSHKLYQFLVGLDVDEQRQILDVIRYWADVSDEEMTARAMTHSELVQISADGLIEIGAHTRFHPMLPQISLERQKEEIVSSKKDLEELLDIRVEGFAYPNGRATGDAKRIIRETGFAFACTSLYDVVRPASDLYALTRFWQKDVDGEKFLRSLRIWMKGV